MAQQTAVEWFIQKQKELAINYIVEEMTAKKYQEELSAIKIQAKEMEKQQIQTAWKAGDGEHDKVADELSKKFYTETYGTRLQNETNSK